MARLAAGLLVLGGCGLLDVSNPGPIEDADLQTPDAVPALVVGMSADYSGVLDEMVRITALASGEIGHGGSYSAERLWSRGIIAPTDVNDLWVRMHRVRSESESGVLRMQALSGTAGFDYATSAFAARANLFAGLSNRLLGETTCGAVFDNGPPQSDSAYFQRAEAHFTEAIRIGQAARAATEVLTAAYGGRAAVRAWQGAWEGAVADAAQVPAAFAYHAIYSANSLPENNSLVTETYTRREFSLHGTSWAQLFGDPRVPWDTLKTSAGAVQRGQDGSTPYLRQAKYREIGSEIPVVKGTEMLLLRAEAALRSGDLAGSVALINQARAVSRMAALPLPATVADAWRTLRFERGAALWLEARRLWDLRRWYVEPDPVKDRFLEGRDKAVPVSADEHRTNPNLRGVPPRACP